MVMDFSDIKRVVKTWIDRELDHKMILRADDPLRRSCSRGSASRCIKLESNPTGGADRPPDLRRLARAGPAGLARHRVGNADLVGHLQRLIAFDLDGTLIDSRRDLADSANQLIAELGGRALPEEAVGADGGRGRPRAGQRALAAAGLVAIRATRCRAFCEIYDTRLLKHTRRTPASQAAIEARAAAPASPC